MQADKHVDQAWYMMRGITCPIDSPGFVCEVAAIIDQKLNKSWQPNTLRTYLYSLIQYNNFLRLMTTLRVTGFIYDIPMLMALEEQCQKWSKSCVKDYKKKKGANPARAEQYINPTDLHGYLQSERALKSAAVLEQGGASNQEVTHSCHTACRNFLLFCLATANCQRTGCLTNMTLDEFKSGENEVKRGSHIVRVSAHKTAGKYGPANIVITESLYHKICNYIEVFRPSAVGENHSQYLFVNWGGSSMDSSSVTHALTTELGHAGIEKKMTCTTLRHLAVTLLSGLLPEDDLQDLSGLMSHSRSTAEGTYNDSLKGAKMVRISNIARKILTQEDVSAADLSEAVNGNLQKFTKSKLNYCLSNIWKYVFSHQTITLKWNMQHIITIYEKYYFISSRWKV